MRKKISIGFISLVLLLFFAGAISVYELNRLRGGARDMVDLGVKNASLAERMLEALQDQNSAVVKMLASEHALPGPGYERGSRDFDKALEEAAEVVPVGETAPIALARDKYREVIAGYANEELERDVEWFAGSYLAAYYELDESVRNFLTSPSTFLSTRTEQLEKNVYRTITPSIITLLVAILIVLMFYFFVDLYYIRPLQKVNKGLKKYLTARIPFDDSFESNDDVETLKEMVVELIEQSKRRS